MSFGMLAAVLIQTGFIIAFFLILLPIQRPSKKSALVLGGFLGVIFIITGILAVKFGSDFLLRYGFFIIAVPILLTVYCFSRAKGMRFLFVAMTGVVFQLMLLTLLMAFRIQQGGFTPLYYLLNVLVFGALLVGGKALRKDFHKVVFAYHNEFACLNAILLLLFLFMRLFSPITPEQTVDTDLIWVVLGLDLLTLLLYIYLAVSFHSMGQRMDMVKDALSTRFDMEEAKHNLARLQASQEKSLFQFYEWHCHFSDIRTLLDEGELDKLRAYLDQIEGRLDSELPETYCQNEMVNLLLDSYSARATECGVTLLIDAQLPENLPIDSTELCALLGNALNNAFQAAQGVSTEKTVRLMARMSDGKLLVQVQNPYVGEVHMENGLPRNTEERRGFGFRGEDSVTERRGFGVRSMEVILEKHNGLSSYEAKNGIFTVRFVI